MKLKPLYLSFIVFSSMAQDASSASLNENLKDFCPAAKATKDGYNFSSCYEENLPTLSKQTTTEWLTRALKALDLASFPAGSPDVVVDWKEEKCTIQPFIKQSSGQPVVDLACLEAVCAAGKAQKTESRFTPTMVSEKGLIRDSSEKFQIHLIPTTISIWCEEFPPEVLRSPSNLRTIGMLADDPSGATAKTALLAIYEDWNSFLLQHPHLTKKLVLEQAKRIEQVHRLNSQREDNPSSL